MGRNRRVRNSWNAESQEDYTCILHGLFKKVMCETWRMSGLMRVKFVALALHSSAFTHVKKLWEWMACLFQNLLYLWVSLWRIKRERASLWSRLSLGVSVTPCSMKNSRTRGKEGMGHTDRQNIEPRRHIKSSSHTLFTLLRTRHHHLLMEKEIFFKKKHSGSVTFFPLRALAFFSFVVMQWASLSTASKLIPETVTRIPPVMKPKEGRICST